MPTIVGILTFISMINTTSGRLKARNFFVCQYFSFMSRWNFVLSWVEHEKSSINSGPGFFNCILSVVRMCMLCLLLAMPWVGLWLLHLLVTLIFVCFFCFLGFFLFVFFCFFVFFLLLKQFFHRHQCFIRTFSRNSSPIPSPTEGVGVDRAMT